jgi:beta-lactamase regulating signal transducer with metallopeptidase domain
MEAVTLLSELGLRGLLWGLFGLAASWLIRSRGPAVRHALWRVVLAGMLALPLLTAVLPPLRVLNAQRLVKVKAPHSVASIRTARAIPYQTAATVVFPEKRNDSIPLWPPVLLTVYGLAIALFAARMGLALRRAATVSSRARRVSCDFIECMPFPRPELRESDEIFVPFTVGWRKPLIILPAGWRRWDDFKLQSVLAHELAHVQRADWVVALIAAVNRTIFWYNPVSWRIERSLAVLSEEACDAAALSSIGDPSRYASVVLDFARIAAESPLSIATSMARTSRTGKRIEGILEGRIAPRATTGGFTLLLVLLFALPVFYAASTVTWAIQPQRPEAIPRAEATKQLLSEGWHVTPDEAVKLESQLQKNPENVPIRVRLLSYYTQYMIAEPRTTHLLWMIEHHPEADVFRLGSVVTGAGTNWTGLNTPVNAERARQLWLQQAGGASSDPVILSHAALALYEMDPRIALTFVRQLRALEPDNPEWTEWLGATYARSVRTVVAGDPNNVRSFTGSAKARNGWPAFILPLTDSKALKSELEASTDTALLAAAGEALVSQTRMLGGPPFTDGSEEKKSAEFGNELLNRTGQFRPRGIQ